MLSSILADVIDMNWHQCGAAAEYFQSLIHRGQRRQFGLLERPSLPPSKEASVVDYKIFLCGRSGVGKTSTIANLAGTEIPRTFCETAGIETTSVYWPVLIKSNGKVMFFRLNFWDVGDNAIKKFEHILPACQAHADCYIYTFSFTDRSSFDDISHLIGRLMADDASARNIAPEQIILGTRADQYTHSDISESDVKELSKSWRIPVLRTRNVNCNKPAINQLMDSATNMNTLCAILWARDHATIQ